MQLLLSLVPAPASQLCLSALRRQSGPSAFRLQAAWLTHGGRASGCTAAWLMHGWMAGCCCCCGEPRSTTTRPWAACGRYEYVMSPCPCHREWRPLPPAPLSPSPPADRVPAPSSRAWLTWWSSDWYVHGGVAFVCVAECTPEHRVSERLCSAYAELVRID
eukprot:COSAG01_NODE_15412_length_1339_cov_165.281225_2_plen_161_part_00